MLKTIMLPLTLTFTSVSFAACLPDFPEIGDIGPGSKLVCNMLESRFPHSSIAILDRRIRSHNSVSVIVTVNGQPESLKYQLTGADWKLTETALAGNE